MTDAGQQAEQSYKLLHSV